MLSNVYTKKEILDALAQKGYFIDAYTLDTFLEQWRVEAIYEDEEGTEFFDKDTLNLILNNLFNPSQESLDSGAVLANAGERQRCAQGETAERGALAYSPETLPDPSQVSKPEPSELSSQPETVPHPSQITPPAQEPQYTNTESETISIDQPLESDSDLEFKDDIPAMPTVPEDDHQGDFDDMSLISESFEAQQKFREYVVSQLAKTSGDLTPPKSEFKLDISERTLNMIARSLAKKITKYVGSICSTDAKASAKIEEIEAKNKGLEEKIQLLEEQNKKLRMLLTESNKNLNSYKPWMFGYYKKIPYKK